MMGSRWLVLIKNSTSKRLAVKYTPSSRCPCGVQVMQGDFKVRENDAGIRTIKKNEAKEFAFVNA